MGSSLIIKKKEFDISNFGKIVCFKIGRVVYAEAFIHTSYENDIKYITEDFVPIYDTRTFMSNYINKSATFVIHSNGTLTTVGTIDSNFVGTFCYLSKS